MIHLIFKKILCRFVEFATMRSLRLTGLNIIRKKTKIRISFFFKNGQNLSKERRAKIARAIIVLHNTAVFFLSAHH